MKWMGSVNEKVLILDLVRPIELMVFDYGLD